MSKNLKRLYLTCAILFVVFSVISFIFPFRHSTVVFWVAYLFGVVAIGIQMIILPRAFVEGSSAKSKFYGFPIAKVSIGYLTIQIVLSLIFMTLTNQQSSWVLGLEVIVFIIALGVAAVGFIATDVIRNEIERQDIQLNKNASRMRSLQSKMVSLVNQCSDVQAKDALEKLSESFRFSDPVSSDKTIVIEDDMASYIDEMQNAMFKEDFICILDLCTKVTPLLARRNQICKQNK